MSEIKFTTSTEKKPSSTNGRNTKIIAVIVAVIVLAIIVIANSFTVIEEGYIGVRYRFGRIEGESLTPGLNMKIPFVERIDNVDIKEQIYQTITNAYTSDTQNVENLQIKLNYYYDKSELSNTIRNIGISNIESKIITPQVLSICKNEIGQFRAEELVQNRVVVQKNIQDKLSESLRTSGIIVSSFALENLDFQSTFEEAVQAKVVAEQEALQMQNKTKSKEELARQQVIEAQANADSTKIKADADAYAIEKVQKELVNSPQYIDYMKINQWDGQLPQVIGDGINPFLVLGETDSANKNSNTNPIINPNNN